MGTAGGGSDESDISGQANADVVFTVLNSVATIRLNRPQKYNGWREADTQSIREKLRRCQEDVSIGAVILTGTGPYFTAGADIMSSLRLVRPSTLRAHITQYNQGVFDMVLNFTKPIMVAMNGPAVGVGVTLSSLTDRILASSTATLHTPFAKLGLPPEGCSSFNFPRLLGEENANMLLHDAVKLDAQRALRIGLVHEVLEPDQLMSRAQELAEEWVRQGRLRPIVEQGLVDKLKAVNAQESEAFGAAISDRRFFEAQYRLSREKGKSSEAWVWWALARLVPLVAKL